MRVGDDKETTEEKPAGQKPEDSAPKKDESNSEKSQPTELKADK